MRHRPLLWSTRWPAALAGALLPSSCALCGMRCTGAVCLPCELQFLTPRGPHCLRCANPLGAADVGLQCAQCQSRPPAFDATVAAAEYSSPLDQLVLQLKFGGALALAPWFGHAIEKAVAAHGAGALPNVLCPVPLGPKRLAERGFNQALEIARPLSALLGVPLRTALAMVRGQHIGLVDDVMTSGATLNELAAMFKRFGAARVSNFVFARTPPH